MLEKIGFPNKQKKVHIKVIQKFRVVSNGVYILE